MTYQCRDRQVLACDFRATLFRRMWSSASAEAPRGSLSAGLLAGAHSTEEFLRQSEGNGNEDD